MDSQDTITKTGLMIYLIYSIYSGLPVKKRIIKTIETITELFLVVFAFTFLKSNHFHLTGLSVIISALYIPVMFLLTSSGNMKMSDLFHLPGKSLSFIADNLKIFGITLLSTLKEELIWRVIFVNAMQILSVQKYIIIISGSVLFTSLHRKNNKPLLFQAQFELFVFSIILYTVYLNSLSIVDIWLLHFIRNISIKAYHTEC